MTASLWAPWRLDYIKSVTGETKGCFLCDIARQPELDAGQLVIARTDTALLLMNRFPYVNGHLLVAPYAHVADLSELAAEQRAALLELALHGQQLLIGAMNPQGFNMGVNIGRCAGAGLPGHVHMHVVPRWNGDINFMTTVGQVRVIPQALEAAFAQLCQERAKLKDRLAHPAL